MLFATQTQKLVETFGLFEGVKILMDAGYPALDFSMYNPGDYFYADDWKETAKKLRRMADERGVIFNQIHAPFGGGYEHYTQKLVPLMPRVFEFAAILGAKLAVVHPLQQGRYYGNEKRLFDMNMEFYRNLAPIAESTGVKVALENMWHRHPITGYIVDDVCADPHELALYYDTLNDPQNFTVCLDIGHVALCNREPQDAIRILGHDRLGALHVHDVTYFDDTHTLPGAGRIWWDAVTDALADIDYTGDFTLEADEFFNGFDKEMRPRVSVFMADQARYLAARVDAKRGIKA